MKIYYETYHHNPGDEFDTITAHDTLDEAITFAEAHEIPTVHQIGGSFDEYEKCWFCGEWYILTELNDHGECRSCELAIWSHGG